MKSDIDIKDDIYKWLKSSVLMKSVTGKLCKSGVRPKDSEKEDVVINVVSNNISQSQSAIVNVNVYVNDVNRDGVSEENTIRLRELCQLALNSMEVGFSDGWRFYMESQRVIVEENINEHTINNRLFYQIKNE